MNKKALLTSVVSLLICVTMLIGTTFAWFTDTASTSVSKIQAGTLKVQLWSANVTKGIVGTSENVGNEDKAIFEEGILWEPGYTAYRVITIKNTGNLAFQFALDVTREAGATSTNLPEAIDAYYTVVTEAPATIEAGAYSTWGCDPTPLSDIIDLTDEDGVVYGRILPANSTATPNPEDLESKGEIIVILALHMKESAGNEYMNKTEKFDIKVYAKQWTEEYDSNGNQYDKDATYDGKVAVVCNHENTETVSNDDGTHKIVCTNPECGATVATENCVDLGHDHDHKCECGYTVTTCTITGYDYNEDGTHTPIYTCGASGAAEYCEPSTGDCDKCHNHVHTDTCSVDYSSNGNGTHNVNYTCTTGGVKGNNETCIYGTDGKCKYCSYECNHTYSQGYCGVCGAKDPNLEDLDVSGLTNLNDKNPHGVKLSKQLKVGDTVVIHITGTSESAFRALLSKTLNNNSASPLITVLNDYSTFDITEEVKIESIQSGAEFVEYLVFKGKDSSTSVKNLTITEAQIYYGTETDYYGTTDNTNT